MSFYFTLWDRVQNAISSKRKATNLGSRLKIGKTQICQRSWGLVSFHSDKFSPCLVSGTLGTLCDGKNRIFLQKFFSRLFQLKHVKKTLWRKDFFETIWTLGPFKFQPQTLK